MSASSAHYNKHQRQRRDKSAHRLAAHGGHRQPWSVSPSAKSSANLSRKRTDVDWSNHVEFVAQAAKEEEERRRANKDGGSRRGEGPSPIANALVVCGLQLVLTASPPAAREGAGPNSAGKGHAKGGQRRRPAVCWLGLAQLALGLVALVLDALSNPISQSRMCVSASLCAVLCGLLSFVAASRWPDKLSLWLLFLCSFFSALLWAALCGESAQWLVSFSSSSSALATSGPGNRRAVECPHFSLAVLNSSIHSDQLLRQFSPCLGPILHSLLLCFGLIGVFLALCFLLFCYRAFRCLDGQQQWRQRFPIHAIRRPFAILITSMRPSRRTGPVQLPVKGNKQQANSNGVPRTGTALEEGQGGCPEETARASSLDKSPLPMAIMA